MQMVPHGRGPPRVIVGCPKQGHGQLSKVAACVFVVLHFVTVALVQSRCNQIWTTSAVSAYVDRQLHT